VIFVMKPRLRDACLWLGLGLAWAGYWAPWIAHRSAALNFNGYELAEWITRLPGVRDGSLRLGRLDFMLPLAAISLSTALAADATSGLSGWLRWPARLLALLGGLLILPEYPFILTAPTDPELRPTLILGVGVMLMVGGLVIWRLGIGNWVRSRWARWRGLRVERVYGLMIGLLVLVAVGFMVRSLVVVSPPLGDLFHAPVRLNWALHWNVST
jgi:hypothetical protein